MTPKSRAMQKADKAFATYIKARDGRCVTCGSEGPLDCSHVFRRGHHAARWNPENAAAQCRSCHFKHHNATEWPLLHYAEKKLGKARFAAMKELWDTVANFKEYQLEEIAAYFTKKTKEQTRREGVL